MISCPNVFDNGVVHCEGGYSGPERANNKRKTASFSILMHLTHEYCNACCKYCCCHPAPFNMKDADIYNHYEHDYPKMIEKIKECPISKGATEYHFDIWGGEPLYNWQAVQEVVDVLRENFPNCGLTISTNGLLIGAKHIVDWLIEKKITVQLSHDGYGQWIRTKIDPLENENIIAGFKRLSDAGLFTAVNCTLSYYNYSFFKNADYFMEHLTKKGINCGYIKLNHIYNSDYDIDAINEDGRWQDGIDESLKGTKIGNVAIRGRILDDYLQEFFKLAMLFRTTKNAGNLEPFRSYIMEQSKRWRKVSESHQCGSCRAYQSYIHDVEGNYKQDWNFVINTVGEYCECNLCEHVDNPGAPMTEECSTCPYKDQSECHPCGSMFRPKKCEFLYKWVQLLEKISIVDKVLKNDNNRRQCKQC